MSGNVVVHDLVIENAAGYRVVDGVSLDVGTGAALGIVGESGSGKTTTALAVLGWVRPGLRLALGTVTVGGETLLGRSERESRKLRGSLVAYVPQDASTALNPSLRVGRQIGEVLRHLPRHDRDEQVVDALELVRLPSNRSFQRRFPHQLSGGQQQRLGLAVALARRPKVLVLDEPTTGLDLITQRHVLDEVDRIRAELGITTVSISHDLALIASRTDVVVVMLDGRVVEQGPSRGVLSKPAHAYTTSLVDAIPDPGKVRQRAVSPDPSPVTDVGENAAPPVLRVEHLRAVHRAPDRTLVVAADDVGFHLRRGQCLALVGESGSGKTTIARCVVGLHSPESGKLSLEGVALAPLAQNRSLEQRRRVQVVFQDPTDSLNPRQTVHESVARPLRSLLQLDRKETNRRVAELFDLVRFPVRLAQAYPAELSGGECQRVAIARALAPEPEVLVCDEITSSLDASIQASVLRLIEDLREELGLSLLFISHNLGVVATLADDVMVIERGVVCEHASAVDVLMRPTHEYTQRLIAASPSLLKLDELVGS